ncbi:Pentatricopeptide repeat-containing protein [Arachis hypogaea]|nr:Pentatricopeptide repeat-containing protein [Arachis hypogaea]
MYLVNKHLDVVTFTTLFDALGRTDRLDEAAELITKMLCKGLEPTPVLRTASNLNANTCHVLIESYLTKGLPLSANRVTSRMFSRNLVPDLKLCQKVSKKLMSDEKLVETDNLMLQLVERGIQQNETNL